MTARHLVLHGAEASHEVLASVERQIRSNSAHVDVPLRWRRLLEFHDHRETRIHATAQVAFARN